MRNSPQNPKEIEVQDSPWGVFCMRIIYFVLKNKTLVTYFPPAVKSMTFNFLSLPKSSQNSRQTEARAFDLPRCFDHGRATYAHTFLDIFRFL